MWARTLDRPMRRKVTRSPEIGALRALTPDGRRLFLTRAIRLFAYGLLAVILALYLVERSLSAEQIGLVLSATLAGDAAITLLLTTRADRFGRRRTLLIGCGLMVSGAVVFALTDNLAILIVAAILGVISPSGSEVGPFQAVEHAALPETAPDELRTQVFAWYNLVGSLATAIGSFVGGTIAQIMLATGATPLESYRAIVLAYAACGGVLALVFLSLTERVEASRTNTRPATGWLGLHRSRNVVLRFAGLSMVDSFGGGLVLQSLMAYWLHLQFGVAPAALGAIFFGTNLLAAFSALLAARIAAWIGLLETMVYTHIPSNVLLILVPLMPTLPLAIVVLLLRATLSQMDVPTRQSYLVAVVDPDERAAASGVTTMGRTMGSAAAPALSGLLFAVGLVAVPFYAAGAIKIAYDLEMLRAFRGLRPPEERIGSRCAD